MHYTFTKSVPSLAENEGLSRDPNWSEIVEIEFIYQFTELQN